MSTTLDDLIGMMQKLDKKIDQVLAQKLGVHSTPSRLDPMKYDAGDKDLVFKFDPKFWQGPSYVGVHAGKCPAEYLRMQVKNLQWKISKEQELPPEDQKKSPKNGKPYWEYNMRDLEKAVYWLQKVEASGTPTDATVPERKPTAGMSDEDYAASDEIPF